MSDVLAYGPQPPESDYFDWDGFIATFEQGEINPLAEALTPKFGRDGD